MNKNWSDTLWFLCALMLLVVPVKLSKLAKGTYLFYLLLLHNWLQIIPDLFCWAVYSPSVTKIDILEDSAKLSGSSLYFVLDPVVIHQSMVSTLNWSKAQICKSELTKIEMTNSTVWKSPVRNAGLTDPLDFDLFWNEEINGWTSPNTNIIPFGLSSSSCRNLFNSTRGKFKGVPIAIHWLHRST